MGLENRYSNLGGRPYNVTNNPVTIDSVLANRPQNVANQTSPTPTITNDSVLASRPQTTVNTNANVPTNSTLSFRPLNTKGQSAGASSLEARPQNPKDKLGRRSLPQSSLFSATPPRNNFYIPVTYSPPSSPSTTPTPEPGVGAFTNAFSNAYGEGGTVGGFSPAFSNAF
tara:strand:+ start:1176 stop:1685 length:510 start_codon:yes stop_codon:yes gene_type:complete